MSETTHTLENGQATPPSTETKAANDNTVEVKSEKVTMTGFKESQLTEEATGFYAALDDADKIFEQVKGLYKQTNAGIYDYLFANVYEKTPIAARAVVCMYRADYCDTLIHAGLSKTRSSDKRTLELLTKVRQVYLDMHDRACGVKIYWGSARKKSRARVHELMNMRHEKRDNLEVLGKALSEPIANAMKVLAEMQAGLNATSERVDNLHRDHGKLTTKVEHLEAENKELKAMVATMRVEMSEINGMLRPLRNVVAKTVTEELAKAEAATSDPSKNAA